MHCEVYKLALRASWKCLLDCKVVQLPVKPVQIASKYGIECRLTDAFLTGGEAGKLIRRQSGKVQIVVNPKDTDTQKRFTILHELGHYLLGDCEPAADRFAAGVLMPACVLLGANALDPVTISRLCGVSKAAAERRSKRLFWLLEHDQFIRHPLEHELFMQFQNFIYNRR